MFISVSVMCAGEKIKSTLGRAVLIIWLFVVLIVTSSYTASLTSILTVQQLFPTIQVRISPTVPHLLVRMSSRVILIILESLGPCPVFPGNSRPSDKQRSNWLPSRIFCCGVSATAECAQGKAGSLRDNVRIC